MEASEVKKVTTTGDEPITSAYAKGYIKVDYDLDDDIISQQITAAREYAEAYMGKTLVAATYTALFTDLDVHDVLDGLKLELPYGPHGDITAVRRVNSDGTKTTLNSSEYVIFGLNIKSVGITNSTFSLSGSTGVGYEVDYAAGTSDVTAILKEGIAKLIGDMYEFRQDNVVGVSVTRLNGDSRDIFDKFSLNLFI